MDGAQHTNILNVGTPFMYCGGSAIGMKQGIVHHMCLKEAQNTALPDSVNEPFEVWKQRMKSGNERCINLYPIRSIRFQCFGSQNRRRESVQWLELVQKVLYMLAIGKLTKWKTSLVKKLRN